MKKCDRLCIHLCGQVAEGQLRIVRSLCYTGTSAPLDLWALRMLAFLATLVSKTCIKKKKFIELHWVFVAACQWDLESPCFLTRDQTWASCIGRTQS